MISEKYLKSAIIKAKQRTPTLNFEKKLELDAVFLCSLWKVHPKERVTKRSPSIFPWSYKSIADSEIDQINAVLHLELPEKV